MNAFIEVALPLGVHHCLRMRGKVMQAYRAPFPTMASRRPVLAFPRDIPLTEADGSFARMKRTDEGLAKLKAETLLLWGKRDPVFPPRVMGKFRERLNVVGQKIYDDASHFLQEDEGTDIGQEISRFMRSRRASMSVSLGA